MPAALRILLDVAIFRLRRFEMANLGGALSIMIALGLSLREVLVRSVFAFLLNLLAYLTNDVCDVDRDLAAGRAAPKTRFLAEHRPAAYGAAVGLGIALSAIALAWSPGLLVAAAIGEGLCFLYSVKLKRVAYADVVVMGFCGAGMALVAVPLDRPLGLMLVAELGLFSACFELIQVLRDRVEDEKLGVRTTAVELGQPATLAILRVAIIVAAIAATLCLHRFIGPILALAALIPYVPQNGQAYWNRVRLVFGIAWLAIIVFVSVTAASDGLWLRLHSNIVQASDSVGRSPETTSRSPSAGSDNGS